MIQERPPEQLSSRARPIVTGHACFPEKQFFVDPKNPETAEKLATMSATAIRTMAEIYAAQGVLVNMSQETQHFLTTEADDKFEEVTREILRREAGNRRFDTNFSGQIHPQGSMIGVMANLIAAYMNSNTVVKEVSTAEHGMELEVVDWLAEMVGYDTRESSGNMTVGGTTANLAALTVARDKLLKQMYEEESIHPRKNDTPFYVLSSGMRHYSIEKSARLLRARQVDITSDNFKMRPDRLEKVINRIQTAGGRVMAVVAIAGETETGMVEDLDAIADITQEHGLYLHVDGAYGAPFVLSREGHKFKGMNRADSITIDPHKMLYTPYAAGAVLFKDRRDHALLQHNARYLQPTGDHGILGDPSQRNFGFAGRIEGSMSSQGPMATWATIQLLGKEGIASLLNHTLDLTQHAYERTSGSPVLKPIHKPETNTLLIGVRSELPNPIYDDMIATVQHRADEEHGYYVSHNGEVDDGRSALRFVAMHPHSTTGNVDELMDVLEHEAENYLNEH